MSTKGCVWKTTGTKGYLLHALSHELQLRRNKNLKVETPKLGKYPSNMAERF